MWFTDQERTLAEAIAALAYANPFLPERVERERAILGQGVERRFWHADQGAAQVEAIGREVEPFVARLAERDPPSDPGELRLYRDVVIYWLYNRWQQPLLELLERPDRGTKRVAFYRRFLSDFQRAGGLEPELTAPHLFAFLFQVRRAFDLVFAQIIGGSMPAARLRAAVWQSIFTRDMRRYRRALAQRMGDVTTLIVGPSGTGKELVARAVGQSRYIPFDEDRQCFTEDFERSFFPLNLSALSPTLIESELFGHRKGAFTGAVDDRKGWLESCPPLGTIFLDEVGEIEPSIQVKLLRVLETRRFQRLGDTTDRSFQGKVVAATNRDFAREMAEGRIREDFYYRLCSDLIRTPSLAEQIRDAPEELAHLVEALCKRAVGEQESDELAREVSAWIDGSIGRDYPWPGNVRELEQCVRNVMIRGEYLPQQRPVPSPSSFDDLDLTLDELERRYIEHVYRRSGSYQAAARKLGIDRRTVKARLG